jgi:hypothetical protein
VTRRVLVNVAHSVHQRLLNRAQALGRPFNEVLQHYVVERFVARLARSTHREDFALKGAALLRVWNAPMQRPTHDLDLLAIGESSKERIAAAVRACLSIDDPGDGLRFDPASLRLESLRHEGGYETVRLHAGASLGRARLALHLDVGRGDAVYPAPEMLSFPTFLGGEPPLVLAYRRETTIAEKFHAMVVLGRANTRLRDFLDVWGLAQGFAFDGTILSGAIAATFARRSTEFPDALPDCFTAEFLGNANRVLQWAVLMRRFGYVAAPELTAVGGGLSEFLLPVVEGLRVSGGYHGSWPPGGPWMSEARGEPG